MKLILYLSSLLLISSSLMASGQLGLELLPSGRPFLLTFSDPREIRMGLSFQGNSQINATVGNYFSLFGVSPVHSADTPAPWTFHVGLEGAGYFTMRQAQKRFPLETADGLIGAYFEGASGPWQAQLRLTHISAHLADGSTGTPIAYSREFAVLRAGYVPYQELQIYAGLHYLINTVPRVDPWTFQSGAHYFLPLDYSLVPFAAMDLKWKQETSVNPSFQLLLGLALNNPPQAYRSFRFYYSYFTGAEPRGQFFNQQVTTHSIGIDMQI
ncbi:DUF1207 domain-containing protein [bacterium]|nr:DUF1207 domain-containing protein [bacterium]